MEEQTNAEKQGKRDYLLPASIMIAAVLIAVSLVYNSGKKSEKPVNPSESANLGGTVSGMLQPKDIDLDGVSFLGNANAPVTIIEYGDYQCPFCVRFSSETEPQIKKDYIDTGKARMVYKDLAFLGPESVDSAEAALCAGDQGKFWEYHDALFNTELNEGKTKSNTENSGNLNRALFLEIANNLHLDINAFTSCIDTKKHGDKVKEEAAEASSLMAQPSTPMFFVNGTPLPGAQPYSAFKQAIDAALQK